MPFRRATTPWRPEGQELTAAMIGVGMLFAGWPAHESNIEGTLLAASTTGMEGGDLRDRTGDVRTPEELARRHRAYYWRVVIGPTYRADMWSALEREPQLASAELARRTYGSFATAWHVRRDFELAGRA